MMRSVTTLIASLLIGASIGACDNLKQMLDLEKETSFSKLGFDATLQKAQKRLDVQMTQPINIPTPKDPGGGYTHEKHKENAKLIYDAGQLYTLTGERKYANYVADLMLAYADLYPGWGLHPAKKRTISWPNVLAKPQ